MTSAPLTNLYRHTTDGELYKEFGGGAAGFIADHASDFRAYHWKNSRDSGFTFAAILDLTSDYDPTEHMDQTLLKAMADEISKTVTRIYTLTEALDLIKREPRTYCDAIWSAMQGFGTSGRPFTYEAKDASGLSTLGGLGFPYMFGATCAPLVQLLKGNGMTYKVTCSDIGAGTTDTSLRKFQVYRTFTYKGASFYYQSDAATMVGTAVSAALVEPLFLKELQPVLVASSVLTDPSRSTNLNTLAQFAPRSPNKWFQSVVQA